MIGHEFEQLAQSYGLVRDQSIYYGQLMNYAVTFLDGPSCHRIMITTRFENPADKDLLMDLINAQDLSGQYGIRKLQIAKKVIHIMFHKGAGAMDKIRDFIDWFFPLLPEYDAWQADICVQCSTPMDDDEAQWVLRDGAVAFRMHKTCAEELKQQLGIRQENMAKCVLGAFLGGLAGALLWMCLQLIGWLASVAGIAIGWLAVWGYKKLGGSPRKLNLPVLIGATLFGIALGVLLGEIPTLWSVYGIGSFGAFFTNLSVPEFRDGIIDSLVVGGMMSIIGLFLAYRTHTRRPAMTVTDLGAIDE